MEQLFIHDLRVTTEIIPLKTPFKTALRTVSEIENIIVEIVLNNGVIGIGAAAPTTVITGDSCDSIVAALTGPIRAKIVGQDLTQFNEVLRLVQTSCVHNTSAKAAADIALYDAYCKTLGISVSSFLGGRKQISTCMTVSVDTVEKMQADAKLAVSQGYSVLKIKVGDNPALDIERIQAILSVIPPNIVLRLDANQGWKPKEAVHIIQLFESQSFPIEFIEQPVKASDWAGLKYVREHVSTPIMADESMFSTQDAIQLIEGNYVDLVNIKLMKCGGIAEAMKIASIAEAKGIACMIGSMMESSISVAAAARVAAAHPNIHYFDLDAPLWLAVEPTHLKYDGERVEIIEV